MSKFFEVGEYFTGIDFYKNDAGSFEPILRYFDSEGNVIISFFQEEIVEFQDIKDYVLNFFMEQGNRLFDMEYRIYKNGDIISTVEISEDEFFEFCSR